MAPQRRQRSKSRFGWQQPTAIALATTLVSAPIVAPARAAVLRDWTFDPTTRQLIVTLPAGVTPNYFLLAQPARIVLNVPNTSLGDAQRVQQYEGAIRDVRLSETQNGARVVLEFAPNTLLDPRHAELSSTNLGNGQTQWTLTPLLQGDAISTVATAPTSPPSESPTATAPLETELATIPEATTEAPVASQPSIPTLPEIESVEVAPQTVESDASSQPDSEAIASSEVPEDAIASEDAIPADRSESSPEDASPTTAAIDEPPQETASITVTPAPDEALPTVAIPQDEDTVPESSPVAIANSATTGAVRSLPTGPDPFHGVSTDASVLAGVGADNVSAFPPEQLPIDPFAITSRSSTSTSDIEETDGLPTARVSVPSLAEVPEAPANSPVVAQSPANTPAQINSTLANPQDSAPTPYTAAPPVAAAQTSETPPPADVSENATIPPPPQPSTTANQSTPQTIAIAPEPETTETPAAVDSIDIPVLPMPPTSWSDRDNAPLDQISPPGGEAIAQIPDTVPPPPNTNLETVDTVNPPPFLSAADKPTAVEEPSIPPPPSIGSDGTVPFGTPLPQTKSLEPDTTPVRAGVTIPEGSRVALQYVGDAPLVLEQQDPVYEILVVTENIYHPETEELILPMGSQVLGRFEGFDESGRRFVAQMSINGSDRRPLLAESDWMIGTTHVSGRNVSVGSSLGAVAVTLLTGFSGIGLLGGVAIGAAAGAVQSPTVVTVEPGQIIEVQVVSEILNFNDAPGITRADAYPDSGF